jgi:hypothetical protein
MFDSAYNGSGSQSYPYGLPSNAPSQARHTLVGRPKLTTTLWEDEGTICYQVDANGICVARRHGKAHTIFFNFFFLFTPFFFLQLL